MMLKIEDGKLYGKWDEEDEYTFIADVIAPVVVTLDIDTSEE